MFRTFLALTSLAWVCAASSAWAQGGADIAARRDLLSQAQAAHDANDHARALDLAMRAGQIEQTPSLRMFIAQEQLLLNAFADALGTAEQCVREVSNDLSVRNRAAIRTECQRIVDASQPHIGRIVVTVPSPAPDGLVVTVNGNRLNPAFYGVPYPVTAGSTTIVASANGRDDFHASQTVNPGGNTTVTIELPLAHGAAVATTQGGATSTASSEPTHATTTPTTSSSPPVASAEPTSREAPTTNQTARSTPHRSIVGPVVLLAIGAVGVVLGGVALGVYLNDYGRLSSNCDSSGACAQTYAPTISDMQGSQIASAVSFAVGGVALGAGVIWLLMGGRQHEHASTRLQVVPWYAGSGAGVMIGGSL